MTGDIRRIKREYEKDQLKGIKEEFRNYNTKEFYRTFKIRVTGYQPQNLCFRIKNGELALNNKVNCETLDTYFEELLNCPEPAERFLRSREIERNDKSEALDESEIKRQILRLRNGRTAGEDGIAAELLKEAGP